MEEDQQIQDAQPSKLKRFIKETVRVIRVTKKPSKEEYIGIVKITSLGTAVIGALGFIIFLLKELLL